MSVKSFVQKIKNMTFEHAVNMACAKFWNAVDEVNDRKICGTSLVKLVPSLYQDEKRGVGMTGMQSTHYVILKRVFSHVHIKPDDEFLDVGCGKGRVLAFLTKEKCPCKLNGIELNEVSYSIAEEWAKRYESVNVMHGDAFKLDYDKYTILFLFRPFLPQTFIEFLDKLESDLTHPITMIYLSDQGSVKTLKERPGWTKQYREKIFRLHGIRVAFTPQCYSVWTYDPAEK